MALSDQTNRLFIATSSKKIAVYDTETQAKLCEVENAHSKGIYGCFAVPEGHDADLVTCSADNTVKLWKLNENALTEMSTILQYEGAEEHVSRQLLNVICFIENGELNTVAVNLNGDLVFSVSG